MVDYEATEYRQSIAALDAPHPTAYLVDYLTGEPIRQATEKEWLDSVDAANIDGGAGVIMVDGRRCYVTD